MMLEDKVKSFFDHVIAGLIMLACLLPTLGILYVVWHFARKFW